MKISEALQIFKNKFATDIAKATAGTPICKHLLAAIAYQETGIIWINFIENSSKEEILELCVGDILDRKIFPKNKEALIKNNPNGQKMYDIAREALVKMSKKIPSYKAAASNPNKFCHGFGIFQYDIQHFKKDPNFFLNKEWCDADKIFNCCMKILTENLKYLGWHNKAELTYHEKIVLAITYNIGPGNYKKDRGYKQGHKPKNNPKYYGEYIADYLSLSMKQDTEEPVNDGAVIVPPITPVNQDLKTYRVKKTVTNLNLRNRPEVKSNNVIRQLNGGQEMKLIAKTNDKFWEIEMTINGAYYKGYVSNEFIERYNPTPAEPLATIPAVYMPSNPSTVGKRANKASAYSLGEATMPKRELSSNVEAIRKSIKAIIDYLDVENKIHLRYKPDAYTYCNIYAHDFCTLAGVYFPRVWWKSSAIQSIQAGTIPEPLYDNTIKEMRVNEIYDWLHEYGESFGWRQTSDLNKLQANSNNGGIGIIIAKRKIREKSGHVSLVVPELNTVKAVRGIDGNVTIPLQSQAGSTNKKYFADTKWWKGSQFEGFSFWIHE